MKRQRPVLLLLTLLAVLVSTPIIRGNVAGGIGPNGQKARPFYNVAHNPNTVAEAIEALDHGANALGPDVMRFAPGAIFNGTLVNSTAGDSGLFMYHDDVLLPTRMPTTLENYLDALHTAATQGKNLALIAFDIKSPTAEYLGVHGFKKLSDAVATHLNHDGVNVNIIYSVATTSDSNYFMDNICLGPREGIMIDQENDAAAVLNALLAHVTTANTNAAVNCGGNPVPYNVKVDKTPPTIAIAQPAAATYVHSATLTLNYSVVDGGSDVATVTPAMDGNATVGGGGLASGRAIDLLSALPLGQHTFTVNAVDNAGNASPQGSVTFTIVVTAESVVQALNQLLASGAVGAKSAASLLAKLTNAMEKQSAGQCNTASQLYAAFINEVAAQHGKDITPTAADILIADAQYLIAHCP